MSPKGDIWCVLYKGVKSMEPETLFINFMDQLYRMARFMLSDVQDAEDAVQETYVRFLIRKPKLKDEEHGKAWLMRVCINICKNQLRFRNRHPQCNIIEVDTKGIDFGEREILREISLLPVKLRSAMILYSIEGYSVKEIAGILKISEAAVKKRLQRGREQLGIRLGGEIS